ncbi:unnamed protein product [Caenorhabditis sp. 36 PRJEB53466]|nr:unnamed protein product [Caenorhabditis sp. 36 PRJEB53466]
MNARTIAVIAVCALLFVSSIDCKKVAKEEKNVEKGKATKEPKVKKVKAEKVVVVEEPVVAETAPEVVVPEVEEVEEAVVVEKVAPKHKVSPPKSLKVTSAYETCKLECRKQRDAVQAADYVEQLRTELVAAEAALAAENVPAEAPAAVHQPVANH